MCLAALQQTALLSTTAATQGIFRHACKRDVTVNHCLLDMGVRALRSLQLAKGHPACCGAGVLHLRELQVLRRVCVV